MAKKKEVGVNNSKSFGRKRKDSEIKPEVRFDSFHIAMSKRSFAEVLLK